MAYLRERGGRYYVEFYDSSRTPATKAVPIGRMSRKAATRKKARLEDLFALGELDPWETDKDLTLASAIREFLKTKMAKSPETIRNYEHILGRFDEDLMGRRASLLRAADVLEYLDDTEAGETSRRTYLRHISVFMNWAVSAGVMDSNPCKKIDLGRDPVVFPRMFTEEEIDRICETIRREVRENRMITRGDPSWLIGVTIFMVETALRRSELCSLQWDDIGDGHLDVLNSKGRRTKSNRDRRIPLTKTAREVISGLEQTSDYVFTTSSGGKMSGEYLYKAFSHYCRKAGVPHTSIHVLRHTACSRLAARGVPVEVIRRFAGHSSISVTGKYMHFSNDGYADWITGKL